MVALPVSVLVYLVLICAFGKRRHLQWVIAAFVLSIFVAIYLLFLRSNPWQIFLIAIFAEILVFLACNIQKRPQFRRKPKQNQ